MQSVSSGTLAVYSCYSGLSRGWHSAMLESFYASRWPSHPSMILGNERNLFFYPIIPALITDWHEPGKSDFDMSLEKRGSFCSNPRSEKSGSSLHSLQNYPGKRLGITEIERRADYSHVPLIKKKKKEKCVKNDNRSRHYQIYRGVEGENRLCFNRSRFIPALGFQAGCERDGILD